MGEPSQPKLLAIPEQPPPEPSAAAEREERKFKPIDRAQTRMQQFCPEDLIDEDHKARSIWDLTGELDLSAFAAATKSREGASGRPAWDPQLLVSVWLYAYSEGIGSARRIARLMEYEPGLRWLSGCEVVNHHTLSDFRVGHQEALDQLFTDLLSLLDQMDVISLERLMHDGTKIRSQAGSDTFRRKRTLQGRLEEAKELLKELGDPASEEEPRSRKEAAERRARKQRQERLEAARAELEELRSGVKAEQRDKVRVSLSEPEARIMKHGDHALAPSYNAQLSTDAAHGVVVGVRLTQSASDAGELEASIDEVQRRLERDPVQVVVDGGFTNRATIKTMQERGVDLIGSLPSRAERTAAGLKAKGIDPAFGPAAFIWDEATHTLRCPAGHEMESLGGSQKRGNQYRQYRARGSDCTGCEFQRRCCPQPEQGRMVSLLEREDELVASFRERMEGEEAREIYRQRGPVAEFPNAWIKERIGLRKFRLRGLAKATTELLWACLTVNVMIWKRLCWKPAGTELAAA